MEAVLSSSLIGLVLFFVLTLFPSSSMLLHQGRFRGHALEWAQGQLESLDQPGKPLPAAGTQTVPDHEFDRVTFHTQLVLQAVTGEAAEELLQVSCRVSWQDALGSHQMEVANYLAQR